MPFQKKSLVAIAAAFSTFLLLLPFSTELNGEEGPALLAFIGRFHVLALHLPIGWLLLVPILEYIGTKWGSYNVKVASGIVLFIGAISAIVAAMLGFSLAVADAYAGSVVISHMWMGIATAISAVLAFLIREFGAVLKLPAKLYPSALTVCLLAMIYTGHLGGTLVQGEGYLTAKLPSNIKRLLNIPNNDPIPIDYDADIFAAIIQPVFRDNCYSCHNDQRYRGKFSVSSYESLMLGSNGNGEVIIPEDYESSELFRRIVMERGDDEVMPPSENPPLAESDIELIKWWIEIGAPSASSVNELSAEEFPQHIANIIDSLIQANEPEFRMPAYDPAFIAQYAETLKTEFGLDVYPISQDTNDGLRVETTNRIAPFDGESLQALSTIAEYVRAIDISGAEFEAGEFAAIINFVNLDQLKLDSATINSDDLIYLAELNLRSLNLFGTRLDRQATEYLGQLRTLKNLYLAETGFGFVEGQLLEQALPLCEILLPGFPIEERN